MFPKDWIWQEWKVVYGRTKKNIEDYQDFLDCMKGFFGKDFPMIKKFQDVLNEFKEDTKTHMEHILLYAGEVMKKVETKQDDKTQMDSGAEE